MKDNKSKNVSWFELWMQQSQGFFESAEKNWFNNPKAHLNEINDWLEELKNQSFFSQFAKDQEKYQAYWQVIAQLYQNATEGMVNEWLKRSEETNPIKNVRELYELWLESCRETYQQYLQSQLYQEAFNDWMTMAFKFWKEATFTK